MCFDEHADVSWRSFVVCEGKRVWSNTFSHKLHRVSFSTFAMKLVVDLRFVMYIADIRNNIRLILI